MVIHLLYLAEIWPRTVWTRISKGLFVSSSGDPLVIVRHSVCEKKINIFHVWLFYSISLSGDLFVDLYFHATIKSLHCISSISITISHGETPLKFQNIFWWKNELVHKKDKVNDLAILEDQKETYNDSALSSIFHLYHFPVSNKLKLN